MTKTIEVTQKLDPCRLDSFLAIEFPEYSRNYFAGLVKAGQVSVNGSHPKSSYQVKTGDRIEITFTEKEMIDLTPEEIPLNILYEDENVIVINKQSGLVVHPSSSTKSGTLINALLAHFPKISDAVYDKESKISTLRPGLVHRLDKDTSGVMIVAKNSRAMHSLARQIQNRTVTKIYWGLCVGWPKNETGTLINYLGRSSQNRKEFTEVGEAKGRKAISEYKVIDCFLTPAKEKISLVEFDIKTGRTHQIRTQSKIAGFPIIGDLTYFNKLSQEIGNRLKAQRQMLHAKLLSITLPGDNKASFFEAPLPDDFQSVLNQLSKQN